MTINEAKKMIDEFKAQGHSDEEILGGFYLMFQDDEISIEELATLTDIMGYQFSEEFAAMSPEDQKTKGYKETGEGAEGEGLTNEQIEESKEIGDEGNKPEEGNKPAPSNEGENDKPEEDSEEDEEAKARKLYGFDK